VDVLVRLKLRNGVVSSESLERQMFIPLFLQEPSQFDRFVEVGRVVLLKAGPSAGKIAVIVEIIDQNRAMIDGPTTDVPRQPYPYRHLVLTPLRVSSLPRAARTGIVRKHVVKAGIVEKWNASSWAKNLVAREKRSKLNDFERFGVMLAKKQRRDTVRKTIAKERKESA